MTDASRTVVRFSAVSGTHDCPGNDEEEGGNSAIIFNAKLNKLYRIMIVHEENTKCLKHKFLPMSKCETYDMQAYFSVTINGLQVGTVRSKITERLRDVQVYAGAPNYPAAEAKYDNLIWESIKPTKGRGRGRGWGRGWGWGRGHEKGWGREWARRQGRGR